MTELIADAISHDPTFLKAKMKLLECVKQHSKKIQKVTPPQTAYIKSYEETIQEFSEIRGSPLFFPYLGSGMGNGALVELADGSVKYDFTSGIGVHWGHSHPDILEAALEGALEDIVMQGNLIQNRHAHELASLLLNQTHLDHCFLTTSGAMANENALKLIFAHKFPADRILAFENCFMGRTLALSQITDRPQYRQKLPQSLSVDYIPFYDWKDPKESTDRAVRLLNEHLERYPKQHACMCMELILGEGGYYPGSPEFFAAITAVLKAHDILIMVDEVQTFGRTDHLFAFQYFGLHESVDVVTVGKLLHNCATLYKSPLRPPPGLISQTFIGTSTSIRTALVILKSLLNDGYLGASGKNMQTRKHLVDRLRDLSNRYPKLIEGPFGSGLMIAFTPYGGEHKKVNQLVHALFEAGLITFTTGTSPTRIRMQVPIGGITNQDIDHVIEILETCLTENQGV